jgi:Kdo2-lipid IVA lauroyltransferase/acyltransferase
MAVVFVLFKALLRIVSLLPFPLLYIFSDFVRFLLQYIIRYRRSVILGNLRNSFPEKDPNEIRKIMNRYYRNLADIIAETIKLRSISAAQLRERVVFDKIEILNHAFQYHDNVIIALAHRGCWEWIGQALGLVSPLTGYGITKPLSNKYFNDYMEFIRNRFNPGSTINFLYTYRTLLRHKKEGHVAFYLIAADQTPHIDEINYWSNFLNQDTPFYLGIEKMAVSLDVPVVFLDIHRVGRGRYKVDFQNITYEPKKTASLEIMEKYIRLLEDSIRSDPSNWLWSHKRWKYKRKMPLS